MDSGPVTSDSTHSNGDFGTCMALRVQPRLAPIRRRASRPLLGAVGRASMGFSRAIGRAQAVRPVVRPSDLNTSTLRPPPGFWRTDDGDAMSASGHDDVGAPRASASAAPSRLPVASVAARTSARSLASRANGAAASVSAPVQRQTATWTDRLLEPSVRTGRLRTIPRGRVGQFMCSDSRRPLNRFVSSGSARFDELRRMMAEGVTPDAGSGQAPDPARYCGCAFRGGFEGSVTTEFDSAIRSGGSRATRRTGGFHGSCDCVF